MFVIYEDLPNIERILGVVSQIPRFIFFKRMEAVTALAWLNKKYGEGRFILVNVVNESYKE